MDEPPVGKSAAIEARRIFFGDSSSVGEARAFVRNTLAETDAPTDLVDAAVLLVSELATNVTLHARTHLQVSVRVDDGTLWAAVKDWNTRVPQACHTPVDATSGRGLQLVDALSNSWGVERDEDGKAVWFRLQLHPAVASNGGHAYR